MVDVLVASDGYPSVLHKIRNVEIPDVPKVIGDSGKNDKEKPLEQKGLEHNLKDYITNRCQDSSKTSQKFPSSFNFQLCLIPWLVLLAIFSSLSMH